MFAICAALMRLYHFIVFCIYFSIRAVQQQPLSSSPLPTTLLLITNLKLVPYEDKYLAEYHDMRRDAIFNNKTNKEMLDAECLVLLNIIKTRLELLNQFMTWTENMSENALDDVVCEYLLESFADDSNLTIHPLDQDSLDQDSECDSESSSNKTEKSDEFEHVNNHMCAIRDVCFHLEKLKVTVKQQMDRDETEVAEYPSADLLQQAREHVCETALDPQLIHNFIVDMTPNGNVAMRYNADRDAFEYFSDRTVPRRFLEAVGRKYVVTFQCPHLFVDTAAEIEIAAKQHAEKAAKTKVREDRQVAEKSKQIFAKFKTYNKPGKKTATTNPYSKNRLSPSASPYQFNNGTGNNGTGNNGTGNEKNGNTLEVVQDRSNTYIYVDKLSASFSPLQKVSQKEVSKKAVMSYAAYKASTMA